MTQAISQRAVWIAGQVLCLISAFILTMLITTPRASAAREVKVLVDTEDPVKVYLFEGSCGRFVAAISDTKGYVEASSLESYVQSSTNPDTCKAKEAPKTYLGRVKGSSGPAGEIAFTVPAGSWVVAAKDLKNASGLKALGNLALTNRIALCKASEGVYALQTVKSEDARNVLGKSLGFGLKCVKLAPADIK